MNKPVVFLKTEMIELPLCCCDCKEQCGRPTNCHYVGNDVKVCHVKPPGNCPLTEVPCKEVARKILEDLLVEQSDYRRKKPALAILQTLNELGFKEVPK